MRFECRLQFFKGEDIIIKVEPHRMGVKKLLECKFTMIKGETIVHSCVLQRTSSVSRAIVEMMRIRYKERENVQYLKIAVADEQFVEEVVKLTRGEPPFKGYFPPEKLVVSAM